MNPKNDETLVSILAHTYGWLIAAVRPGDRDGAAEVAESFQRTGTIPYHLESGSRREREAILRELAKEGLLTIRGNTQATRAGLTWPGVCRSTALTVGREEIKKTFAIMRQIAELEKDAGGPDVSPSKSVPEYLLAPELGTWWQNCTPENREVVNLARARHFFRSLPALCMGWLHVSADCHGRRWFKLTSSGHKALENPPPIPRGLPPPSLCDFSISECDRAWEAACRAEPKDRSQVFIPQPASRWWTVKEAAR